MMIGKPGPVLNTNMEEKNMKEYCFCYWRSNSLPTDVCVKVDLGAFASVKAATLHVIRLAAEDPFFSPRVEERGRVGSLCTMDGRVCAILYQTAPGRYRWRNMDHEIA